MKALLLSFVLLSSPTDRYEVHRQCFDCLNSCRRSPDRPACEAACRVLKVSSCRSRGLGPGPTLTCDCT